MKDQKKKKEFPFKIGKIFKSKFNSIFHGTYLSYLPDKYSDNLHVYSSRFYRFYSKEDIPKWTNGNYINNAGDLIRFYFLNLVIDQLICEGLTGDIAELGVYKGNSAFLLSKFARVINKKLYLFDTFQGFDEKDISGIDDYVNPNEFQDTSLEYVKELVSTENVEYIKGYFPDSLAQVNSNINFCLVHIDCDLEKPMISALDFFYPRMIEGGFLIMHDYSSLYWEGA